jgi:hypothetical protein
MKIVNLFALASAMLFAFQLDSLAQAKEISREEFSTPLRDQYASTRKRPSRKIQEISYYQNGKKYQEKWTYENQPPDRVHYIHVESFEGKVTRTEEIEIGKTKYCKKDGGEWTVNSSYCTGGGGMGGLSNIIKQIYTVEKGDLEGKKTLLYHEYTTYKNVYSKTADSDGPSFLETRYWVDHDGADSALRVPARLGFES